MKKTTKAKISALCAAAILLTACASSQNQPKLDPDKPVTLTLWHYYNGQQKTAFDAEITAFNETVGLKEGIVIKASNQGTVNDLTTKVMDSAAKKVGAEPIPNIFAAYMDTAYAVDKIGLVASLDKYLTKQKLAEYRSEFIDEGRFAKDGSLKIFPVAKSVELMAINKTDWDKFSAASGADIKSLSTIEGVVATSEEYYKWTDSLTSEPNDGKALFGRDAMANYMLIGARQLGVELFNVKDGIVSYNLDKPVLRKLWDNYYIPFVKGYFAAENRFRSDDIKTGNILALVGSSSGTTYFPDKVNVSDTQSYPITSLIMPAPIFEGGEKYAVQQGAGMVVTKSTPEMEYACTVFLQWFTDEERNIRFAAESSYMPVKIASCDMDKISQALGDVSEQTLSVFENSLLTLSDYTLYTSRAFEGGVEARAVLESSMASAAKADSATINELMASGTPREEALAEYLTDARFDKWYTELKSALASIA